MTAEKVLLPMFVQMNGVCLRLTGSEYWRDAGKWGIYYTFKDGKLVTDCPTSKELHHVPLIKVTEEEWRECNIGYDPSTIIQPSDEQEFGLSELYQAFRFYAFASTSQQPYSEENLQEDFFNFLETIRNKKVQGKDVY